MKAKVNIMAHDTIKQLQATATKGATVERVTLSKAAAWCDTFSGTAEALIASGLITADQLPGQPGMPKVSATFYNGARCDDRRKRVPRDLGYMNVSRPATGKKVTVQVGIPADEAAKRRKALNESDAARVTAWRAKQAAQAVLPAIMDEAQYRNLSKFLLDTLWSMGRTEGREPGALKQFPFELSESAGQELLAALEQIERIFLESPLRAVTSERVNLVKARDDCAFQSFLRLQCIPSEGASHA